jgi:hypothetical protein
MSPISQPARPTEQVNLERLCTAIRGKLQFMDYLVRAAAADVDRLTAEDDPGTRIFLRQLVEMHAQNLAIECENMRLVGELCNTLETACSAETTSLAGARNGGVA